MHTTSDQRLVSVIIPAYACGSHVKQCLDSILSQTYRYLEVIVVYDPSPDNTLPILQTYNEDVILIKQKRKTNPATSRNIGSKIAKGRYIAFCDADDYFEKTKIERQVNEIEQSGADITYTDVIIVDEKSKIIKCVTCPELSYRTFRSWMANPFVAFSSVLTKKEVFEKAGCFDQNLDTAEDFDLLLRLIISSKIIRKTPGFLTFYRISDASLSRRLRIRKDFNRIKIFKKYGLGKQIALEIPRRLLPKLIICFFTRPKEISRELLYLFRR